jgi:hypothetical protein
MGVVPSRKALIWPDLLPIYAVSEARSKDLRSSRYPPFGGVPLTIPSPHGYLAINKWKSGGSFGQECGLAATIKQESENTC